MKATYVCGLKGKQNLQNLNNLTSSSNKVDEFVQQSRRVCLTKSTSLYHETGSIGERKTYETWIYYRWCKVTIKAWILQLDSQISLKNGLLSSKIKGVNYVKCYICGVSVVAWKHKFVAWKSKNDKKVFKKVFNKNGGHWKSVTSIWLLVGIADEISNIKFIEDFDKIVNFMLSVSNA